jgi:hypothetical protein
MPVSKRAEPKNIKKVAVKLMKTIQKTPIHEIVLMAMRDEGCTQQECDKALIHIEKHIKNHFPDKAIVQSGIRGSVTKDSH